MQKITVRRVVLGSILLCMSLMAIVTLCFNILSLAGGVSDVVREVTNLRTNDNGFSFVGGDSVFFNELYTYSATIYYIAGVKELATLCKVFCIVFLVAAIAAFIMTVLWFFFGKSDKLAFATLGICLFVAIGYMTVGLVVRAAVVESYTFELMAGIDLDVEVNIIGYYLQCLKDASIIQTRSAIKGIVDANIKTAAYIPLIISLSLAVFYIAFAILYKKSKHKTEKICDIDSKVASNDNTEEGIKETFKFEYLRELKQLFDDGILTEEEFIEQKRLALGKKE